MDTAEEPQKKVFKARKTMKASDRQQLDAIHKSKDLLKPTELKLVNGSHENGDSDIHNDSDSLEDKNDLNGIIDINCDRHVKVSLSDLKEGLKSVEQVSDLKLPQITLSESIVYQDASKDTTGGDNILPSIINSDTLLDENVSALQTNDHNSLEGLSLLEDVSGDKISEEQSQANVPEQSQANVPAEVEGPGVEELNDLDVNCVEDGVEKELQSECMHAVLDAHSDKADCEQEMHHFDSLDRDSMECNTIKMQDHSNKDSQMQDHSNKDSQNEDDKELHDDEMQNIEAEKTNVKEQTLESINHKEPELISNMDVVESEEKQQPESVDIPSVQQDVGEEAISSSVEVDQTLKNSEQSFTPMAETSPNKSVSELQPGHGFDNLDSMETDEIIPILEKLAPVEDEVQSFSKPDLNSESVTDEETAEAMATSPSKNDMNTSLPSEAFLVLSDEEELCDVITPKENASSADQDTGNVDTKEAPEVEQQGHQEIDVDPQAEKSEAPFRKRSKSEDLDGQSSKRRRFEGEEYEAELKVKITAGEDLNKKLQKVIQRLFEEKLTTLQCSNFDKAMADLKTRVEKIECKKHENVIHSMQAKISRLTKRFGAAKEDLKKRPEQTTVAQTASPGKSTLIESTPSQVSNSNSANYRNTGTVRQMLDSKRGAGETTTTSLQTSTAAPSSVSSSTNLTPRTSNAAQTPVTQSPSNAALQTRAPPDWKLIQQKINAQNTQSAQSKPNTPVTSAAVVSSVLTSPTATVVGNSQVSTSTTQPMSVSLQSLPVILHVPVAMSSQSQILQGATGTLVTNQQSGNVEFIPVQNQSTVSNLTKTPVTIPVTKAISSPSMPSPSIQRSSPAASSIPSTLAVQAVPASHPITISRPSLPTVASSGIYNQTSNRSTVQLKSPGFNNSSESSGGRTDLQINRAPASEPAAKRTPENISQAGKSGAGVIDLTLDDDPEVSSKDSKMTSSASVSTIGVQPSQSQGRQSQIPQMNNLQSSAPVGLASQATMHVGPTAQTTVNITQRPGTQAATRASAPRAPNAGHMVYTTTALPNAPAQTPIRNTVMQNPSLRQMTPQAGGVSVRMPQTAAYVVNNGMQMGTGPQLTVHHRPPQETARPIHPAALPEAPQPQRLPPESASTSAPQKPHLKLARVQSQNGIVLSWSVLEVDRTCAAVDSYHLYAYHEDPSATSPSQWKKIGEVKALPLPMACTLTQFVSGSKYYFAVRAKDIYGRFGPFCDPQSTDVISTQSS